MSTHETDTVPGTVGKYVVFVAGLAVTAASMSSGFIWASQGEVGRVYVAAFLSWTGYVVAHYAVTGVFVDPGGNDSRPESDESGVARDDVDGPVAFVRVHLRSAVAGLRDVLPEEPRRAAGFVAGVVVLVAGITLLAFYVRQGNHLLGTVGSGMFLGGYALAHYFDHGVLL